jgi:hypothetical protein
MEEANAAHRALEMETASRRQSATTRVRGPIGSAEIFAEPTRLWSRVLFSSRCGHWASCPSGSVSFTALRLRSLGQLPLWLYEIPPHARSRSDSIYILKTVPVTALILYI